MHEPLIVEVISINRGRATVRNATRIKKITSRTNFTAEGQHRRGTRRGRRTGRKMTSSDHVSFHLVVFHSTPPHSILFHFISFHCIPSDHIVRAITLFVSQTRRSSADRTALSASPPPSRSSVAPPLWCLVRHRRHPRPPHSPRPTLPRSISAGPIRVGRNIGWPSLSIYSSHNIPPRNLPDADTREIRGQSHVYTPDRASPPIVHDFESAPRSRTRAVR